MKNHIDMLIFQSQFESQATSNSLIASPNLRFGSRVGSQKLATWRGRLKEMMEMIEMIEMIVASSALILAVLAIRRLTKGKISMRLRYALWLLVALRLAFPVFVAKSPVSLMNLIPAGRTERTGWTGTGVLDGDGKNGEEENRQDESGESGENEDRNAIAYPDVQHLAGEIEKDWEDGEGQQEILKERQGRAFFGIGMQAVLRFIWLAGAAAVAGNFFIRHLLFLKVLYRNRCELARKKLPPEWADRLAEYKMKVYLVKGLPSPCLVGRAIYVNPKILDREERLVHVLAHEYSHARQYDTVWAVVRSLLVAVYWFDPLVWAAAYAAKQDSELACDEAAIGLLGKEMRYSYGRTLLYLLSEGQRKWGSGTMIMTMDGKESGVRERVSAIAAKTKKRKSTAAFVCGLAVCLCGCAFTGAAERDAAGASGQEQKDAMVKEKAEEDGQAKADGEKFKTVGGEETAEGAQGGTERQTDMLRQQLAEEQQRIELDRKIFASADRELAASQSVDYQACVDYWNGEGENPLEDGAWYLIEQDEEDDISLYGLYTEKFGFRGLKIAVGGDVNSFDELWTPYMQMSRGLQVLSYGEDGKPESFAFTMCMENTSTAEIWKLYVADRYDTGRIELYSLDKETCLEQIRGKIDLEMTEDKKWVSVVVREKDMAIGYVDIGAIVPELKKYTIQEMVWDENVIGYQFRDNQEDGGVQVRLYAAVGVRVAESDEIWYRGFNLIEFPVQVGNFGEREFRLGVPLIRGDLVNGVK